MRPDNLFLYNLYFWKSPETSKAFLTLIDLIKPLLNQGFENCFTLCLDNDLKGACMLTSFSSLLSTEENAFFGLAECLADVVF